MAHPKPSLARRQAQPMSSSRHWSSFSEMEEEHELYFLGGISMRVDFLEWGKRTMLLRLSHRIAARMRLLCWSDRYCYSVGQLLDGHLTRKYCGYLEHPGICREQKWAGMPTER